MVCDSADGKRVHTMVSCNSCHERPQFGLELFTDYLETVFGAENDVDVIADVRTGHLCRPCGTLFVGHILPGTSVPGYRFYRSFGTGTCPT